jgi:hypothetical protein
VVGVAEHVERHQERRHEPQRGEALPRHPDPPRARGDNADTIARDASTPEEIFCTSNE